MFELNSELYIDLLKTFTPSPRHIRYPIAGSIDRFATEVKDATTVHASTNYPVQDEMSRLDLFTTAAPYRCTWPLPYYLVNQATIIRAPAIPSRFLLQLYSIHRVLIRSFYKEASVRRVIVSYRTLLTSAMISAVSKKGAYLSCFPLFLINFAIKLLFPGTTG